MFIARRPTLYVACELLKDYYEQLWERLPDDLHPPELELRTRLLRGEIRLG